MLRLLLLSILLLVQMTFTMSMAHAGVVNPDATGVKSACPDIGKRTAPDDIPLQTGRIALPEFNAQIDIPPSLRFIRTIDARSFMFHEEKWSRCDTRSLVGFIVSPQNWRSYSDPDVPGSWMITVYYEPTFVSDEDIIVTDYDQMVQEVRQSLYDREQAYDESRGAGFYNHVMGWAIPPDYNIKNDTTIWSLHIVEGNAPDYTVPVHAIKMGRFGHFKLHMNGWMSRNKANYELMRQASNALQFNAGQTFRERSAETDYGKSTTIGKVIAESVNTRRATPLTWTEYFRAVLNGLWHLALHYAVEVLAFGTLAVLAFTGSLLKRRRRSPLHNGGGSTNEAADEFQSPWNFDQAESQHNQHAPKPVAMLNGVPFNRL
jgi:uncharacterized membrane-anchored protein